MGFVDLAPWKRALEAAEALAKQNPNDLRALRLLAEIYTETQWAIRAWEAWMNYREKGGTWDEAARQAAAKVARTLAFYANPRGDRAEAERSAARPRRWRRASNTTPCWLAPAWGPRRKVPGGPLGLVG